MFLHEFKKVMGMRMVDHTCLYTSKPGEGVCCIKMLDFEACRIEPPRPVSVVAVGMLHKVEVCFLKPEHKIAIRISRQEADGSLMPSLAWNFVPIRGANQQFVVDPVLAFSWGRNVRFMQMSILVNEKKPTDFRALGTYRSKATIISVRWLTDKTIMTMDTQVCRQNPHLACYRTDCCSFFPSLCLSPCVGNMAGADSCRGCARHDSGGRG